MECMILRRVALSDPRRLRRSGEETNTPIVSHRQPESSRSNRGRLRTHHAQPMSFATDPTSNPHSHLHPFTKCRQRST